MALSLVGIDFGWTKNEKGIHCRNDRAVQDRGSRFESSRRHEAKDQRRHYSSRSGSLLRSFGPFPSRPETGRSSRSDYSQHSSLLSEHDFTTHPPQVGRRLPRKRSASSSSGMAPNARPFTEIQGPYSVPDVSSFRQSDAVGVAERGAKPNRLGRSEGHQQAHETSSRPSCEGCLANPRRDGSAVSNDRADRIVFRVANQRNPGFAVDRLRFQAIGGFDSTISGWKAFEQIENGVLGGRSSDRKGPILELRKWQSICLDSKERWLFPSPMTGRPYHADSIRADYLVPTGLQLGLGRIGFHTFRHTYRAWLDETGAPVGVQQKLMRHAHVSTTMDQYGNASAMEKRKANRPIVQRLLRRSANQQQIAIQ